MRLIFAGTPEFAAVCLDQLINHLPENVELVGVWTQPDRPAGRGRKLKPSPVKMRAQAAGIPVHDPVTLRDASAQAEIEACQADLMIVVAYGLILPQSVLDLPRLGCVNVHASLLPAWRGAAPIQRALLAGDPETGVTLMQMEAGLDTGPMLAKRSCPIRPTDTSQSLHDTLATLGAQLLTDSLPALLSAALIAEAQADSQATYASKLTKEEAQLDWRLPAAVLDRSVRGYNPWPVAWFEDQQQVIRVWQSQALDLEHNATPGTLLDIDKEGLILACAEGCLKLLRLQLPGTRQMSAADLLNGHPERFQVGQVFGVTS